MYNYKIHASMQDMLNTQLLQKLFISTREQVELPWLLIELYDTFDIKPYGRH